MERLRPLGDIWVALGTWWGERRRGRDGVPSTAGCAACTPNYCPINCCSPNCYPLIAAPPNCCPLNCSCAASPRPDSVPFGVPPPPGARRVPSPVTFVPWVPPRPAPSSPAAVSRWGRPAPKPPPPAQPPLLAGGGRASREEHGAGKGWGCPVSGLSAVLGNGETGKRAWWWGAPEGDQVGSGGARPPWGWGVQWGGPQILPPPQKRDRRSP